MKLQIVADSATLLIAIKLGQIVVIKWRNPNRWY